MVTTRRLQQDDNGLDQLDDIPVRLTRSNRRELMGGAATQKEELDDNDDENEQGDEDSAEGDEDDDEEDDDNNGRGTRQERRRSSRVSEMESRQRSSSGNRQRGRSRDGGNRHGGSGRRSSRISSSRDNSRESRRDHPDDHDSGRRRSARFQSKDDENNLEEEDDDDDDDDDSDSESDGEGRKYSFRDRAATTRRIINIENLGGDGAGMAHSEKPKKRYEYHTGEREMAVRNREHSGGRGRSYDSYDRGGRRYTDQYSRYNFGSKYDPTMSRKRRRSGGSSRRRGGSGRRHYDSSSESSSSGSDRGRGRRGRGRGGYYSSEDDDFREYERRRLHKERDSVQPMDFGGSSSSSMGGSLKDRASKKDMLRVDALPVAVDSKIGFEAVGGLDGHVNALKEMVVLPLLYPDVFSRFDTQPPRGVLFTGPPGTGKTLTARALANSVSTGEGGRGKVNFFMRKGADCLSKWVGEGERQLRLLFEQARRYQPSIIFFDEIDGLAPVRSVKQDQIHASIVSTLLALMDGLDSRGQVVVIGATNRPDAIDPALRRPGRFDRELSFSLPDASARASILNIHTGECALSSYPFLSCPVLSCPVLSCSSILFMGNA